MDGLLVYHSDEEGNRIPDFSHSGYRSGEVPFPSLDVHITLQPCPTGDDADQIQQALDQVGMLPINEYGHRGAVLLSAGNYRISRRLYIRHSGLVLRGSGDDGDPAANTIVHAAKNIEGVAIQVGRGGVDWSISPGSRVTEITTEFVPVGSRFVEVRDATDFETGDDIVLYHKATWEWIESVDHGGRPPTAMNPWTPDDSDLDIVYKRRIVEKSGNVLQLDVPVFNHLDRRLSVVQVYKPDMSDQISEAGVEHFRLVLESDGPGRDDHTEHALMFNGVEHGWAFHVTVMHFRNTGIGTLNSSFVTVSNSRALEPHSPITGNRRNHFRAWERSNNILFRDNFASQGRHCYDANGAALSSGIVFLQSVSHMAYSSSEGHRRWSQGLLFDNITFVQPQVRMLMGLYNRGDFGTRHGWSAAHSVIWNSDTGPDGRIIIQKPPGAQNYGIANRSTVTGIGPWPGPEGFIEGTGMVPEISSLYEAQHLERLLFGTPPDAPARLAAVPCPETDGILVSWDHTGIGDAQLILQRSAGDQPFEELAWVDAAPGRYSDSSIDFDRYRYRAAIRDANRMSAWSNPSSCRYSQPDIYLAGPGYGSTLAVIDDSTQSITFEWTMAATDLPLMVSWQLFAADDSRVPLLTAELLSNEPLADGYHRLSIPLSDLHKMLVDIGLPSGGHLDAVWTIMATFGVNTTWVADPFSLRFTLDLLHVSTVDGSVQLPMSFALHQNYPNPFNPQTTITYELPESGPVQIAIFDALGRLVAILADEVQLAGVHSVVWDGFDHASGTYFCRISYLDQTAVRSMTLVR